MEIGIYCTPPSPQIFDFSRKSTFFEPLAPYFFEKQSGVAMTQLFSGQILVRISVIVWPILTFGPKYPSQISMGEMSLYRWQWVFFSICKIDHIDHDKWSMSMKMCTFNGKIDHLDHDNNRYLTFCHVNLLILLFIPPHFIQRCTMLLLLNQLIKIMSNSIYGNLIYHTVLRFSIFPGIRYFLSPSPLTFSKNRAGW